MTAHKGADLPSLSDSGRRDVSKVGTVVGVVAGVAVAVVVVVAAEFITRTAFVYGGYEMNSTIPMKGPNQ